MRTLVFFGSFRFQNQDGRFPCEVSRRRAALLVFRRYPYNVRYGNYHRSVRHVTASICELRNEARALFDYDEVIETCLGDVRLKSVDIFVTDLVELLDKRYVRPKLNH